MKWITSLCLTMFLTPLFAQSIEEDVTYWIGQGADSAVFIVDFNDSSDFESYAWGILFNDSIDGATIVQLVAQADPELSVKVNSGFLNDITYLQHAGLGGQPDYWSTWDGADMSTLTTNLGLASVIYHGDIFACSYTDFNPATYPGTPVAARDPFAFTFADVTTWVGQGADSAVLVIDFNDSATHESYAWGYLFDGTTDGTTMLDAIVNADPQLQTVVTNGFLNDVTYGSQAGLGGQPDYWSTWEATNMANWTSNLGLASSVQPGAYFGCSYTDFNPAVPPSTPVPATIPTGINQQHTPTLAVFPNPGTTHFIISSNASNGQYQLFDLKGNKIASGSWNAQQPVAWPDVDKGMYILQVYSATGYASLPIQKQ